MDTEREARDARIFDAWLACYTQEEIAEAEDIDQSTIAKKIPDFMNFGHLSKIHKTHAEYADDFTPPIYNIWTQKRPRIDALQGRSPWPRVIYPLSVLLAFWGVLRGQSSMKRLKGFDLNL